MSGDLSDNAEAADLVYSLATTLNSRLKKYPDYVRVTAAALLLDMQLRDVPKALRILIARRVKEGLEKEWQS